jgi:hypothetical protein
VNSVLTATIIMVRETGSIYTSEPEEVSREQTAKSLILCAFQANSPLPDTLDKRPVFLIQKSGFGHKVLIHQTMKRDESCRQILNRTSPKDSEEKTIAGQPAMAFFS